MHCLLQRCFKRTRNRHDFAGGFHLRAEGAFCGDKLVKRPLREFDDAVVERRFKRSKRLAGNGVGDFVKPQPQRDFCRHTRNRVAGRFRRERRRTRNTGVYFDNGVTERIRVQGKLHVAAALNAELRDDVQSRGTKHLIVFIH